MKSINIAILFLCLVIICACAESNKDQNHKNKTGTSEILNEPINKDPKIMINQVEEAMGGSEGWQNLKYVSWTFFGNRHLIWDKLNNRVRIEVPKDSTIFLLDMKTKGGKYTKGGKEIIVSKELKAKLSLAKSIWINDMYWLFMPFKLNDPGVIVQYDREENSGVNEVYSVFTLNFDNVGNTPENKYEIFVDHQDHLIKKWNFFKEASKETFDGSWPWDNYKDYNGLILSADRSDNKGPSNIRVYDVLDDKVFTSLEYFEYY